MPDKIFPVKLRVVYDVDSAKYSHVLRFEDKQESQVWVCLTRDQFDHLRRAMDRMESSDDVANEVSNARR